MRDDWYGHRDPFSGAPEGDKDEWLTWDYLLMEAFEVVETITLPDGSFVMDQDDDAVQIQAIKTVDKFQASIDNITSGKNYKAKPGEKFKPRIVTRRSGGKFTLYSEYLKAQADTDS